MAGRRPDIELEELGSTSIGQMEEVNLHDNSPLTTVNIDELELSGAGPKNLRRVDYGDFSTIDWTLDRSLEKKRVQKLATNTGLKGWILRKFDSGQTWLILFLIGISTGFIAGSIDIVIDWMSSLKQGTCSHGFWLNQRLCCWESEREANCPEWIPWGQRFGGEENSTVTAVVYIIFAVLFSFISALFVRIYAPYAAGTGIPELKSILGGFVIKRFLGLWTLCVKCVGLVFSVSSGLAVGKEEPLIHIAACCANIYPRLFDKYATNEVKKREIISAAVAAGMAVAFGAPIGGVLFCFEGVSYYFHGKSTLRAFFCAMIACATLRLMNPYRTGKLVLFEAFYDPSSTWIIYELIPFALLGVLGGLIGGLFIKLNILIYRIRKMNWFRYLHIPEVLLIAFLTALIQFPLLLTRVSSSELLSNLFIQCSEGDPYHLCNSSLWNETVGWLLLTCLIRFSLTTITFGIKIPAGFFLPSMVVGAALGRAVGILVQQTYRVNPEAFNFACGTSETCIIPGVYAIIGAASVLCGISRTPMSVVVLILEITGALKYLLPIILTVIISKWVGDLVHCRSIFDEYIRLNGYPYLEPSFPYRKNYVTAQVMTSVEIGLFSISTQGNTIASLEELLNETQYNGYPVVNTFEERFIIGYIHRLDLMQALATAKEKGLSNTSPCYFGEEYTDQDSFDLRPYMDRTPIIVGERQPMEVVLDIFRLLGVRYVLVEKRGQLVGIITKKDMLRHIYMIEKRNISDAKF